MTAADLARDVLPVLRKYAAEVDEAARFPVESMAALRASGLLGLIVDRDHGGLGGELTDLVEVAGVLASGCLSTAMIWVMHCQQTDAVARFATARLRTSLLPRIAAGEVYLASVTSERGTGGHLLTGVDPLVEVADGWQLTRDAPIVTGAEHADGFLVTMRARQDAPESEVSLVYLDREQLKVQSSGDWNPLGMRATASSAVRLSGFVPTHQVIGKPGGFHEVVLDSFAPVGHLGWAACWIGAARSAFRSVVELYGSPRRPSGFDVRSDAFTGKLGRIRTDLEMAAAYLHRTVDEVLSCRSGGGRPDDPASQIHINTLKVVASELAYRVVDQLMQLVGLGLGYQKGSPLALERLFRDLRSASLNYHNERLLVSNGRLCLLDRATRLS